MKKLLLALSLSTYLSFVGCSEDEPLVSIEPTPEEIVIANSYAVQTAAEAFAAENNGEYPRSISVRSLAGNTIIDLLPGGTFLENPFTQKRTEPDAPQAVYPGKVGYRSSIDYSVQPSIAMGYLITGFGESSEIIALSQNYPDSIRQLEDEVVTICYEVQQAAEQFATENGGVYASDVNVDTTPMGDTVIDLLPGGTLVLNPFTNQYTNPYDGAAVNRGEVAYLPTMQSNGIVGYIVTARGQYDTIAYLCKTPTCDP